MKILFDLTNIWSFPCPDFELSCSLEGKHPKSIDRFAPPLFSLIEKFCFEGSVHNIHHRHASGEKFPRDRTLVIIGGHANRSCVDQHIRFPFPDGEPWPVSG